MFAAIPYFALGVYDLQVPGLGSIPIDPWATIVCIGFIVGMEVARARAIKLGLDVRDVVDGVVFVVSMGFLMGHVVTVVAYHPERLRTDGIWSLLRFWEGFSSFGGFLGALVAGWLFFNVIRPRDAMRHADVIGYAFPFAWIFGRLACGVVHDHVGSITTFPLAMRFPEGHWAEGVRHELGLYESEYMVLVSILFYYLGRKDRPPGFFLGLLAVVYSPVRFGFDFLRNTDLAYQDVRYYGLTPAQWGCFVMLGLGLWALSRLDYKNFKPWALDGKPYQAERAAGLPIPEADASEADAEPARDEESA